jgi:hypothetical protein
MPGQESILGARCDLFHSSELLCELLRFSASPFACSAGYSVARYFGLKVGYLGTRSFADTGIEFDSVVAGATFFWSDFW